MFKFGIQKQAEPREADSGGKIKEKSTEVIITQVRSQSQAGHRDWLCRDSYVLTFVIR